MSALSANLAHRFEGRLFNENGHLCLVLDVDPELGMARVSYREDGERKISQRSVAELTACLGASGSADALHSDETDSRISEAEDGWWFATREGRQGPFSTKSDAQSALSELLLSNTKAKQS